MSILTAKWFKGSVLMAALMALTIGLAGCNTVEGAGEDIEGAGDRIQDAAD